MLRWRPDGDHVSDVPLTRRIMPFIMRSKAESNVYFDQKVDMAATRAFLRAARERTGRHATLLHLIIYAAARVLNERPRLNRFTAGGRIWQRRGIWVTFSAKKGKTDDDPVILVKRRIDPAWSFDELVANVEGDIADGRSDKKSGTDKELELLFSFPLFVVSWFARLIMLLNHAGLLPSFFMRGDPMFTSIVIANLGSIRMDAGFHHLYEYGNCPIFLMVGQAQKELVPGDDDQPVVKELAALKYTFDERVEDGLYCLKALDALRGIVEDPHSHVEAPAAQAATAVTGADG
jgi:hypothetical protein